MEEDEEKKKRKSRKRPKKSRRLRKPRFGAAEPKGRASRPSSNARIIPQRYSYPKTPKVKPKTESTHWNGKVDVWTKPILPKKEKVVKYEVDTEKLLEALEKENEDAINKLAEQIEQDIENMQPPEQEEPESGAEAKVENDNDITSAPSTEESEDIAETELPESDDPDIQELLDATDEDAETSDYETTLDESVEDDRAIEATEALQDIEAEQAANEPDSESEFGAELVLFNPDFWREIGNDLWDDIEQVEPEAEYAPAEEAPEE